MSEKYSDWLTKLKKKYQSEIDKLQEEEYRYLVSNYRFEGSTLLFILNIQFQLYNLTILIINHNSKFNESCKYLGSITEPNNQIENRIGKIELKIDENEELHPIKQELMKFFENQLKKKRKPQGKGKHLGGGTIGRDSWFRFLFEGNLEDISIDDFFSGAIEEAKDRHQKRKEFDENLKKRNISVETIKLLIISDRRVKLFIDEVKKDLEEITNNMPSDLKKAFINRSVVIENNALEKYGFIPKDSKGCSVFKEIIPIEYLTIQADLDSRRFRIQIRGLYGYLIEEILQKYIINPDEIENCIVKKLNQFITCYKTKKIPYKILLPLNGIIADTEESNQELLIPLTEKAGLQLFEDAIIITLNSDLILGRSVHYNKDDIEKGINRAISIYCKGTIDFEFVEQNSFFFHFDRTEPESINDSNEWVEIRNIFSSFILSNFKIGYSKQFYKFPWWFPKKRYQYDFPTPEWLRKIMYFNPSEKMSIDRMRLLPIKDLVPESYHNITFPTPIDKKGRITFSQGNISNGNGFFSINQGRSHEMGYQETHLKMPSTNFQIFRNAFSIYSNIKYPINFHSSQFVINKLISLRLREKIEDTIMDSCLLIESLLITGNRELSYQFRLHASLLISNDISELRTNIGFFDDLYNLRSRIVHGDEDWHEIYRKFLNNHTRWEFTKSEWNYDQIEFTRSEVLNLIFMKIIRIIIRINDIGLDIKEIQKPHNLIANLKFNPQDIDLKALNHEQNRPPQDSQEEKQQKWLKKLKRIERKFTSIIDSEKLVLPNWYENLKIAITNLKKGEIDKFQEIFCNLNIREWKFTSKNQIVINGILSNLEKIKEEICSEK